MSTNPACAWQLLPLPALTDNYIWLLAHDGYAVVVDPGAARPVLDALAQYGLTLAAILLTHHHHDHVGGAAQLHAETRATVYGPASEVLPVCDHALQEGERVHLENPHLSLSVLDVPGHTAGHIAFFANIAGFAPVLFCGDTLFAAGCGRLFEGTPAQMVKSLAKLAALPQDTLLCCAHEYTLSNLRWALQVEANNPDLQARARAAQNLRDRGLPTLPSTLELELQTNPFLRCAQPAVVAAACAYAKTHLEGEVAVFAALRAWKNQF